MAQTVGMMIEAFKDVLKRSHCKNDYIAISVLRKLEEKINTNLEAPIYPLNLGTDKHKTFIAYIDNELIIAYSKDIEVEKIDFDTEEKYIETEKRVYIDRIKKHHIKSIKLFEDDLEYDYNLELYINLDIEFNGESTLYLNGKNDNISLKNRYGLNEYTLMDSMELLAKELS